MRSGMSSRGILNTVLIGIMLTAALLAGAQAGNRRIALVIGNAEYSGLPKLRTPVNDTEDVAAMLKRLGFEVTTLRNVNRKEIDRAVSAFREALSRDKQSEGFFYYAGHGVQANGLNYLIPVGAEIESDADLEGEAVGLQRVLANMEDAGNRVNVVVVDACRDNPLPARTRSAGRGLAVVSSTPPESVVLFSTAANEVAADGDGRNSPFAKALIDHLADPGDVLATIKSVTAEVKGLTGGKQTPFQYTSLDLSYELNPSGGSAAAKRPTMTVSRSYGSLIVNNVSAGSFFLDGSPMGDLPAGGEAKIESIEAGKHELELRYPSGPSEIKSVEVRKSQKANVSFVWKPSPAEQNGTLPGGASAPMTDMIPPAALAWPTQLSSDLKTAAAYSLLYCNVGAYGGGAFLEGPLGMRVRGIWTNTACWLKKPLPDKWIFSCQMAFMDEGSALFWLGGPGHGNSPRLGYCLELDAKNGTLFRDGEAVVNFALPSGTKGGDFQKIVLLRDGPQLSAWMNDAKLFSYQDDKPLSGVLHSYLAFGCAGGGWATGVRFKNLKLQSNPLSAEDAASFARIPIAPASGEGPSANGRLLMSVKGQDLLGADWYRFQQEFMRLVGGQLVLTGPNGTPFLFYRHGFDPDFAFEVDMQYVPIRYPEPDTSKDGATEAYLARGAAEGGFMLLVKYASAFPNGKQLKLEDFPYGWEVMFPDGGGDNRLTWISGQSESDKASTPYWTPMAGNAYTVRVEVRKDEVRVLVDGAEMLHTTCPSYIWDDGQKAFVGFQQRFEGVIVRAARVYQLRGK